MGSIDNAIHVHNGITFQIDIEPDLDSSIDDYDDDVYGAEDRAEYRAGNWSFVTVLITPQIDGVRHPDSMWKLANFALGSVEYGHAETFSVTLADIVKRADEERWFDEAMAQIREMSASLTAALATYDQQAASAVG